MGVAKRSLSPGEQREMVTSLSEEVNLPAHLSGQRDIRSFCSMKSSCQSDIAPTRVFASAKRGRSNSDAEEQELPLLKLPGQRDMRFYLRPSLFDKYYDAFYQGDEEAAVELGMSLGLESDDEETQDEKFSREAQESEMEVCQLAAANPWSATADYFEAAEEAAVAMGLSVGMASPSPADDVEDFLEAFAEDLIMQQHVCPREAGFALEEEAAQAMGLNLSLLGGSEEELDMPELDLEPEEAISYELNGGSYHYKAEEEAAASMGLSLGIGRGEEQEQEEVSLLVTRTEGNMVEFVYNGSVHRTTADAFKLLAGEPRQPPKRGVSSIFEAQRADRAAHGVTALLMRYNFALEQGSEEAAEKAPDYHAEEEAAIAMGLSLSLGEADEEDPGWPDMSELEPQPEEAKDYQAEEDNAEEIMPLTIGRGHGNEQWATDDSDDDALAHVDKKARVYAPAEELTEVPGTPPKRMLVAKTSMDITPPQDAKRRRLLGAARNPAAEKFGKDVVVEVKHAQHRPLVTMDAQVLGD